MQIHEKLQLTSASRHPLLTPAEAVLGRLRCRIYAASPSITSLPGCIAVDADGGSGGTAWKMLPPLMDEEDCTAVASLVAAMATGFREEEEEDDAGAWGFRPGSELV